MKQTIKKILVGAVSAVGVTAVLGSALTFYSYKNSVPTVTFDASNLTGKVTSGASGYLYGLSENGVPSEEMTKSLKVSSVSAKVLGGLQHPIGDIGHVAPQLIKEDSFDYMIVYLQDVYKTWYYDHENITEQKKNGTYDFKKYLKEDFFQRIKPTVTAMLKSDYADKLVFCIFNECDNGIWFGDYDNENGKHIYGKEQYKNFNEAWKMTYEYVKSLAPSVKIGGPGNFDYNRDKTDNFLKFASENDCAPDVMIYHELSDNSIYNFSANVDDLKKIEAKYGIDTETPIIVTEYGRMEDNGNPNVMLRYITRIENSKVYANQAYWLMANNLCNTCADYNTPNSAWWVYRFYADLQGQTMAVKVSDFFHCDFKNAIKNRHEFRYKNFLGVGTLSDKADKLQLLVTGADYDGKVKIENLDQTKLFGKNVKVEITQVTYQGISGKVYRPETLGTYTEKCSGTLEIDMSGMDSSTAYKIDISLAKDSEKDYLNNNLYKRFEFENGTLLGGAYTYNSAYATTGEENGMVGGIEKKGDGVELSFKVPKDGEYELGFIFGKANDGKTPDDRTFAKVNYSLDGKGEVIRFPNTVRSEITDCLRKTEKLSKGTHKIKFEYGEGTFTLDSLIVREAEKSEIYFEKENSKDNTYLIISKTDGYHELKLSGETSLKLGEAKFGTDENGSVTAYLKRGLNYLTATEKVKLLSVKESDKKAVSLISSITEAELEDGATIKENKTVGLKYLSGISSKGGKATFLVNAPEKGTYKLTVLYSNNLENGVHDYNVDLVESYITLCVDGFKQKNLFCRNTYSDDNFVTVTTDIKLRKGENYIFFKNDGMDNFNGGETFAPNIAEITICPVTA